MNTIWLNTLLSITLSDNIISQNPYLINNTVSFRSICRAYNSDMTNNSVMCKCKKKSERKTDIKIGDIRALRRAICDNDRNSATELLTKFAAKKSKSNKLIGLLTKYIAKLSIGDLESTLEIMMANDVVATKSLKNCMNSPDDKVRESALLYLVELRRVFCNIGKKNKGKFVEDVIINSINDRNANVAVCAIEALISVKSKNTTLITKLINAICNNDANESTRISALKALNYYEGEANIAYSSLNDLLLNALASDKIKSEVCRTLVAIESDKFKLLNTLRPILKSDFTSAKVKISALCEIGNINAKVDIKKDILSIIEQPCIRSNNDQFNLKLTALSMLRKMELEESDVSILISIITSDDEDIEENLMVRLCFAKLGQKGDTAIPKLHKHLARIKDDNRRCEDVIQVLEHINSPKSLIALQQLKKQYPNLNHYIDSAINRMNHVTKKGRLGYKG